MHLELTCPLDSLGIDTTSELPPDVTVEFERMVPIDGDCLPFLAVEGADSETVVAALRGSDRFDGVSPVEEAEERSIYRLHWSEPLPAIVDEIADADGAVRSAAATDDAWHLRVRFPSHRTASRFYERHSENGGDATVRTITPRSPRVSGALGLTELQRETLRNAFERGYFDVPRRTTLTGLAAEQGISDTAVSQRIRRGTSTILETVFTGE
jgi:predicted DNA binding protein